MTFAHPTKIRQNTNVTLTTQIPITSHMHDRPTTRSSFVFIFRIAVISQKLFASINYNKNELG